MGLTTRTLAKAALGIAASDTSEDSAIDQWIREATWIIKNECQYKLCDLISANTLANPTVITSLGHGLKTGQSITIFGSNCTPTIDGAQTVTRIDEDTFSVAVNVTGAGTAGTFVRSFTEYYCGNGTRLLPLRQRPVQSITSVYEDNDAYFGEGSDAFASADLLTAGEDYVLQRQSTDTEASRSGILVRLNRVWPAANQKIQGLLAMGAAEGVGNIKVTYVAGLNPLPHDLVGACNQLVAVLRQGAQQGGPLQSESLDYYSYSLAAVGSDGASAIGSIRRTLGRYKKWVW